MTETWDGTWLQTAWLIPSARMNCWDKVIDRWATSNVFDTGRAHMIAVDPRSATSNALLDPEYRPEFDWSGDRATIIDSLRMQLPARLDLTHLSCLNIEQLRLRSLINQDDSVSIYLSAPLRAFEDEPAKSRTRFGEFLGVSESLFEPECMLAGTIGEEAQIHGAVALQDELARWTGRAFYGYELADDVGRLQVSDRPAVRHEVNGGLFVMWEDWPKWKAAPQAWQTMILGLLKNPNGATSKRAPYA